MKVSGSIEVRTIRFYKGLIFEYFNTMISFVNFIANTNHYIAYKYIHMYKIWKFDRMQITLSTYKLYFYQTYQDKTVIYPGTKCFS